MKKIIYASLYKYSPFKAKEELIKLGYEILDIEVSSIGDCIHILVNDNNSINVLPDEMQDAPHFKFAREIYKDGMEKVKNTEQPKGQKFLIGSKVSINKGNYEGKIGTVEYTYAHAFGGDDVKSYSLNIDEVGSVAWFEEDCLTKYVIN